MKLWHVQFDIVIKETLRREPDKYRNLMVRIAGYSAYIRRSLPRYNRPKLSRERKNTSVSDGKGASRHGKKKKAI